MGRSTKKVFLKISQNSHENTCVENSFFNKVAVVTIFYRTPPVAASEKKQMQIFLSITKAKVYKSEGGL